MGSIFFAETNIGKKRELNEDYMISYSPCDGCNVYAVLDGIGGSNSGEVASRVAGSKIIEYIKENFVPQKRNIETIVMAVKYANKCVYEMNKKEQKYKDMGTTVSLIYIEQNEGYIINVGDSRAYEIGSTAISQLTEDDTYVNALVRDNIISKEEAKTHPDRHVLVKALGVMKSLVVTPQKIEGSVYDRSFLLCTDGLTITCNDNEIFEIVSKNTQKNICKCLIEAANKKGGPDNITIIYIKE